MWLVSLLWCVGCEPSGTSVDSGTDQPSYIDAAVEVQVDPMPLVDASMTTDAAEASTIDAEFSGDAALETSMDAPHDGPNANPPGAWTTAHSSQEMLRTYFNCISGDGTAAAYTIVGGVTVVLIQESAGWRELERLGSAPLLVTDQNHRCAFSHDGLRLIRATRTNATVSERRGAHFEVLAELQPYNTTFGLDPRVLMSADGRRAVIGGDRSYWVFEDQNGGWQNWHRESLPDGFGHPPTNTAWEGQLSATPDLSRIFATGLASDQPFQLRAVLYERTGSTWTMTDRTSACQSRACALNSAGTLTATCEMTGEQLSCSIRTLDGVVQQELSRMPSEFFSGAASLFYIMYEKDVQWAGDQILMGLRPLGPSSGGSSSSHQIFGYRVYSWQADTLTQLAGTSAQGDFAVNRNGDTFLATNGLTVRVLHRD